MTEIKNIDRTKLLNLLEYINKHTAENPASTQSVMELFNLSERQLRMYIAYARKEFHASIATHGTGGYFRATGWEQYKRTFHQRMNQAIAEIITQNAVRKSLKNDLSPTLFDQDFSTEFDDLIDFVEDFNQTMDQKSEQT